MNWISSLDCRIMPRRNWVGNDRFARGNNAEKTRRNSNAELDKGIGFPSRSSLSCHQPHTRWDDEWGEEVTRPEWLHVISPDFWHIITQLLTWPPLHLPKPTLFFFALDYLLDSYQHSYRPFLYLMSRATRFTYIYQNKWDYEMRSLSLQKYH